MVFAIVAGIDRLPLSAYVPAHWLVGPIDLTPPQRIQQDDVFASWLEHVVALRLHLNEMALQVRNARTAMLAALGFATQAWVTGKGPLENAYDHLKDPFGANSELPLEHSNCAKFVL